ncbi:hypothetical protein quinque_013930 [Culex quinquefasciatus]
MVATLQPGPDLRQRSSKIYSDEEDIDGMPLVTTEDIDCVPMQSSEKKLRTSHPSGKVGNGHDRRIRTQNTILEQESE